MTDNKTQFFRSRGVTYPLHEHTDVFTGEVFQSRAPDHYEPVDPVPFAPQVDTPRPTVRQRIENLLNRGVDPLAAYVGTDDYDMDVPDDPEAPLTPSEQNFVDAVAASLAEAAPLPDEGMPRPEPTPPPVAPSGSPRPPEPLREDAAAAPKAAPPASTN